MDGLTDVLDDLKVADSGGRTTVGDVLDAFENRSLGAILTVLGVVAAIPVIGGIPGMSILTGTLVLIAAGQSFIGRSSLWAPETIRKRGIDDDKFDRAIEKARPYAERVDKWLKPRLGFLAQNQAVAICCVFLALTCYPMAVVLWGVTAPAAAVALLGLSLIGKDGIFALLGYAVTLLTLYLIWTFAL